ncbi:hypothetical protein PRZ48_005532 [Zasmidium cellare]|uniref:Uncharacterized protein n=1 Tax=Zasmidium cellare TaxID=395010 RepID=A0ABR0EL48_ZASCE|nr:hypothetical protein PRZ48_005532 [Zasmidium cellare]
MAGNEPQYVPFVRDSGDDAKRDFIDSLSTEEGRNYHNRITLQSYSPTILTDISTLVPQISPTPDDGLPGQKQAYELAKEPKLLVTLKGHHFSPYTTSKSAAIEAAKNWFSHTFELSPEK